MKVCQQLKITNPFEVNFNMDTGVSEELLIALLKLLMKYLMDDSVRIVDLTSQSLRVSVGRFRWFYLLIVFI